MARRCRATPHAADRHEPGDHHRPEEPSDGGRALPLDGEQRDDDHRGDRHDPRRPAPGSTTLRPSTADSTEIAGVIMLSPKNRAAPKMPSAASATAVRGRRAAQPPQQRDERHDAALAVVVGAHHERDVGQRDDDHHRPEDQRDDAEHVLRADRHRVGVARVEDRLEGVDRAGADVAEHDPECTDNKGQPRRFRNTLCARRRHRFGNCVHCQLVTQWRRALSLRDRSLRRR